MQNEAVQNLFNLSLNLKASGLMLVVNSKPQVRVNNELKALDFEILDEKNIQNLCFGLINDEQKQLLKENKELDFAIEVNENYRARANFYHSMGGKISAVFRFIPKKIQSLDELGLPQIFKEIIKKRSGLILVTGATGSGKSTTLAAMLNEINLHERKHIITIEDPVEFIHENKLSLFSHRNVGTDTHTYANALKFALRQDPDVLLIGEMRDAATMAAAMTAAETGHLVFATLHTNDAVGSISRIIDSFEPNKQNLLQNMLSSTLVAVISQILVPTKTGSRVALHEILINNFAIANIIRENKLNQIYSHMQLNQAQTGMQTMSQALVKAYKNNQISQQDALAFANNKQEVSNLIGR
ncbi:MAG: PilT/PilU family type 4a pilus ATPase [Campylobacter sp.]|nr:PilT/PilU family type 4a pilus ATPase [Campylobacter sp.]